jgi:hypothetical protein
MNRQLTALPNPLVADLLELEPGTPVRLTFGARIVTRRLAGVLTTDTVVDTVEAYYERLGDLWSSAELREDQPLAVRFRHPWSRYDTGRPVSELTAVEVLEHLTGECSTCKSSFPLTTKIRPRECPSCATATAAAGAAALEEYPVGARVHVHAFGHWYAGEVVKVGKTNVTVRYTTGTGVTRDKSVNPSGDLLRPGVA